MCYFDQALEVFQMRRKIVVNADLADGRTERGHAEAAIRHAGVNRPGLFRRIIRDVFAVNAAGFDEMDAQTVHDLHLTIERSVDLVAKTG